MLTAILVSFGVIFVAELGARFVDGPGEVIAVVVHADVGVLRGVEAALAAVAHVPGRRLRGEEAAAHVDREREVESAGGEVEERLGGGEPGVVDHVDDGVHIFVSFRNFFRNAVTRFGAHDHALIFQALFGVHGV